MTSSESNNLPPAKSLPIKLVEVLSAGYMIVGVIGSGRISTTLRLRHKMTGKDEAAKYLNDEYADDPEVVRRFERVYDNLVGLHHDGILKALECSQAGFTPPFILMKYMRHNLTSVLAGNGRLTEAQSLALLLQLAEALKYAHENGIIHGGIEPNDVFLSADKDGVVTVSLSDFGMSRVGPGQGTNEALGATGESFGNVRYMSPEQCKGHLPDARSDIYSLGCLAFEMLTGRPVYALGTDLEVMLSHSGLANDILLEGMQARGISQPLCQLVDAMLAKLPEERPASMQMLVERLQGMGAKREDLKFDPARYDFSEEDEIPGQVVVTGVNPQIAPPPGDRARPESGGEAGRKKRFKHPKSHANLESGKAKDVALDLAEKEAQPSLKVVQDKLIDFSPVPSVLSEAGDAVPEYVFTTPSNLPAEADKGGKIDKSAEDDFRHFRQNVIGVLLLVAIGTLALVTYHEWSAPPKPENSLVEFQSQYDEDGVTSEKDRALFRKHFTENTPQSRQAIVFMGLSAFRPLEKKLASTNADERLEAITILDDLVKQSPENVHSHYSQPERMAYLTGLTVSTTDAKAQEVLARCLGYLAASDTFRAEYLSEKLELSKDARERKTIALASKLWRQANPQMQFGKLEEALAESLAREKDKDVAECIAESLASPYGKINEDTAKALVAAQSNTDSRVRALVAQALKRYESNGEK